jgi:cobalamin biosynthesis Mg chelatase CobN
MKNLASIRTFLLVLFSLSLFSCGMLHKVTTKKNEHKIETEKKNLDSAISKKSDSTSVKTIDSSAFKKKEEVKTSDVSIVFADSSDHNKVEVVTDSSGKQVIKAEGKIKSVNVNKKEERKLTDSSSFSKKDTAGVSTSQQTKVKDKGSSTVDNKSTVVNKDKKDRRLPWYGYLIGIVVIILLTYYLYRKYRYNVIAWFIQLKNPGTKVFYDPKIKGYQIITKNEKNTS